MARLEMPAGDQPEIVRVWSLRPEMGAAVQGLSYAVYSQSELPARVREAARMRIAHINDCAVCRGWRIPELADQGVDEELYAHVQDPDTGDYSAQERLAIEFAERFALEHLGMDDAFFTRLRDAFDDGEIVDLAVCCGAFLGLGRVLAVLGIEAAAPTS